MLKKDRNKDLFYLYLVVIYSLYIASLLIYNGIMETSMGPKLILNNLVKKKKKLINFLATENEINLMKDLCRKYANGNLSQWIVYSSINYRPSKDELSKENGNN